MTSASMNKRIVTKKVRLGDYTFLRSLTEWPMLYTGASPDTIITVAAAEGYYHDWAAYFQTPESGPNRVAKLGNKLPQKAAEEIFPDWAKKGLEWRD